MVEPYLTKLNWEIPKYKSMVKKMMIISACTGGIGGLVYGSTPTDVYGDTSLYIRFIDIDSGTVLFDNTYNGHYVERMAKLNSDLPKTKSRMIGESLKKTMRPVKTDAKKVEEQIRQKATASSE